MAPPVQNRPEALLNRRLALAAVMAFALAPQMFAGTWLKSVAAAQKVAKEKNQLILVDMFANWCGWCHRFEREVFPAAAFQEATKDVVLLRLDTEDGKEGTQFARKYGVTQLPTFLLLDGDLAVAGTIRGYAPAPQFVKMLNEQRAKHNAFVSRVENEATLGNDWVARLQLAKDFTERGAYDKSQMRLKKLTTEKAIPAAFRDQAYYELAVSYVLQNKPDEALKTIRQLSAISNAGEAVEQARLLAGQIYLQQGNLAAAATEFRNFKESFPGSPHVEKIDQVLPEIEKRLAAAK